VLGEHEIVAMDATQLHHFQGDLCVNSFATSDIVQPSRQFQNNTVLIQCTTYQHEGSASQWLKNTIEYGHNTMPPRSSFTGDFTT
jgi:hypothetical protein